MSPQPEKPDNALIESLTKIVTVYLERNSVPPEQLPGFIDSIFKVLLREPAVAEAAVTAPKPAAQQPETPAAPRQPAVPVEESITPDYIICLEDGAKLKLLKRYLKTKFSLTPQQYRERWSLPKDYPMVAPVHSARRAEVAKANGLGARRAAAASSEPVATPPAVAPAAEPTPRRKPGRRRSAVAAASAVSPETAPERPRRGRRPAAKSAASAAEGEATKMTPPPQADTPPAEKKSRRRVKATPAVPRAAKPRRRKADGQAQAT